MLVTGGGQYRDAIGDAFDRHPALGVADVWISLAYSWSALLWVVVRAAVGKTFGTRRGRKAMNGAGAECGFIVSMLLCGLALYAGLSGLAFGGMGVDRLRRSERSLYWRLRQRCAPGSAGLCRIAQPPRAPNAR